MITPGPFVASWPKEFLRQPGIEPGSIAWEATMLTITPLTQRDIKLHDDVALLKKLHVIRAKARLHLFFCIKSRLDHWKTRTRKVRQPGIEPGSIAWKATMLTFTPPTPWQLHQTRSWFLSENKFLQKIDIKTLTASAGNRTRIYCLEGNNANLYTTDAVAKGTLKRGCMVGKQDEMNVHFFQHISFLKPRHHVT